MNQACVHIPVHVVFTTKNREALLTDDLLPDLLNYIKRVAFKLGIQILAINGYKDHIHILLMLPQTKSISECMHRIKGASSHWINKKYGITFRWQGRYGAFAVSQSGLNSVISYIENQKEIHTKRNIEQELKAMLRKHGFDTKPGNS